MGGDQYRQISQYLEACRNHSQSLFGRTHAHGHKAVGNRQRAVEHTNSLCACSAGCRHGQLTVQNRHAANYKNSQCVLIGSTYSQRAVKNLQLGRKDTGAGCRQNDSAIDRAYASAANGNRAQTINGYGQLAFGHSKSYGSKDANHVCLACCAHSNGCVQKKNVICLYANANRIHGQRDAVHSKVTDEVDALSCAIEHKTTVARDGQVAVTDRKADRAFGGNSDAAITDQTNRKVSLAVNTRDDLLAVDVGQRGALGFENKILQDQLASGKVSKAACGYFIGYIALAIKVFSNAKLLVADHKNLLLH